jgi:ABC-type phosphate transport system substrate-binding protein
MLRHAAFVAGLVLSLTAQAEGLAIIANPKVPLDGISIEDLTLDYLIQKNSWSNGVAIVPINREPSSPSRAFFCEQLFNRSANDMTEYWDRLRFMGKFPPQVQTSDQAVLAFVRSVPGAIGYVDDDFKVSGVKVLLRIR